MSNQVYIVCVTDVFLPTLMIVIYLCDKTMKHNQPYDIWVDYVDEMGKSFRNCIDAHSHWMDMPKDLESMV